ncbi:Beta-lactamase-related protein [Penicillium robsamsonii]|uniref:Beta-lactamase-related protein n=1 Tax=Penicillium robsamsonii TaxID=1792511 RepID=UPI002546E36B|nr:Beta-lactamase-related protein [Penicillium robsamsonii]KAJ5823720.1 Beta-lactamase-related protein [Penicillium robsamsonii]
MVLRNTESPLTSEFDALVNQQMNKWKVPGLSMAVVHGSSTWSKAYGLAELPNRKMTTDSLFSTCSTTKAFTAAAMSLAIDDSKNTETPIGWDTPIASILRDDFVLENDYSTMHTTIEDALSHRSGLPTHDACLSLVHPRRSLREAVRNLRHLPMAYAPRTTFSYNNNMYMAVSHALEQIEGRALGETLKKRIWDPLEMNDTYFSVTEVSRDPSLSPRLARGYTWDPDTNTYIAEPYMNDVAVTGAGAMVSSVLEYTKWLRTMIYQKGPVSTHGHAEILKPRTVISNSEVLVGPPTCLVHLYALGWFVDTYHDEPFYWHSGSWPGFGIMVGFLPSKGFGFAMMGNTTNARQAQVEIYMHLLNQIFGGSDILRSVDRAVEPENKPIKAKSECMGEAIKRLYPSLPDPVISHSLPLSQYVGKYENPAYSSITLSLKNGYLVADLLDRAIPSLITLAHVSGEFFVAHHYQPKEIGSLSGYYATEFIVGSNGISTAMGMDVEPALNGEKMWFDRKA